jgi:GH24 family phage-related lysozyme (muramidase)
MSFKKALGFSAAGLIMLAMHEGYSPTPYKDTAGVMTNGFGNATINPNKNVNIIEALTDLQVNTQKTGEGVARCVTAELTQGQYDAYVSFAYNVGVNAFCKSTMAKLANQGDKVASCNQFDRWVYVAGKDCRIKSSNCAGIAKRRAEEKTLCLS